MRAFRGIEGASTTRSGKKRCLGVFLDSSRTSALCSHRGRNDRSLGFEPRFSSSHVAQKQPETHRRMVRPAKNLVALVFPSSGFLNSVSGQ